MYERAKNWWKPSVHSFFYILIFKFVLYLHRYLVLANMLMESQVNPFDGQEAKPYVTFSIHLIVNPHYLAMFYIINESIICFCRYKNDPEILAMTNLIAAYQRNEILEFEKIVKVKTVACYVGLFTLNFFAFLKGPNTKRCFSE